MKLRIVLALVLSALLVGDLPAQKSNYSGGSSSRASSPSPSPRPSSGGFGSSSRPSSPPPRSSYSGGSSSTSKPSSSGGAKSGSTLGGGGNKSKYLGGSSTSADTSKPKKSTYSGGSDPQPARKSTYLGGSSKSEPISEPKTKSSYSSGSGGSSSLSDTPKTSGGGFGSSTTSIDPTAQRSHAREVSRSRYARVNPVAPKTKTVTDSSGKTTERVVYTRYVTPKQRETYHDRERQQYDPYLHKRSHGYYQDSYNPWFTLWMIDHATSRDRAMWVYNHPDADSKRIDELVKDNAEVKAELAKLKAEGDDPDPSWVPDKLQDNADLMYSKDNLQTSTPGGAIFLMVLGVCCGIAGVVSGVTWLAHGNSASDLVRRTAMATLPAAVVLLIAGFACF